MGAIPTIGIFRQRLTTRSRPKGWVLTLRLGLSHRSNRPCPCGTFRPTVSPFVPKSRHEFWNGLAAKSKSSMKRSEPGPALRRPTGGCRVDRWSELDNWTAYIRLGGRSIVEGRTMRVVAIIFGLVAQGSRIRVYGPMLWVISEASGSPEALTEPAKDETSAQTAGLF